MSPTPKPDLITVVPSVINIGLEQFGQELSERGVAVLQLDWTPPAGGDAELADMLSRLGS